MLGDELAHAVRARSCVLDDEIVCRALDRRSVFNRLLFRRDWPHFVAFDVLSLDGQDLRDRSFLERKRRLRAIMRASTLGWSTWITSRAAGRICLRHSARATSKASSPSGSTGGITATAA